jgi:hypothetical protein
VEYADQTDRDYQAFLAAISQGRIKVGEPAAPVVRHKVAGA